MSEQKTFIKLVPKAAAAARVGRHPASLMRDARRDPSHPQPIRRGGRVYFQEDELNSFLTKIAEQGRRKQVDERSNLVVRLNLARAERKEARRALPADSRRRDTIVVLLEVAHSVPSATVL